MTYFNETSVLYILLTLDIRRINDIRLISSRIHAPSHELENKDTNTALIKVVNKRIWLSYWALAKRVVCSIYGVRTH